MTDSDMNRTKTNTRSITLLSPETKARYTRLKNASQSRQGGAELINDEFMAQLLEVYEYHLNEEYKHDR